MRIVAYGGADDSLHQLTVSLAEEVVGDLDAVARRMREERLEHVLLCIEGLADAVRIVVGEVDVMDVKERSGRKLEELARGVKALVVTLGAKGSLVMTNGRTLEIPAVPAAKVVDPTGCGDAYRAGLLYGIAAGFDLPVATRLASVLGSIKIGSRGGQNHRYSRDEVAERYRESYGSRPW